MAVKLPLKARPYQKLVFNLAAKFGIGHIDLGANLTKVLVNLQAQRTEAENMQKKILDLLLKKTEPHTMKYLNDKLKLLQEEVRDFSGEALDSQIVQKYDAVLGEQTAILGEWMQQQFVDWIRAQDPEALKKMMGFQQNTKTDLDEAVYNLFMTYLNIGRDKSILGMGAKNIEGIEIKWKTLFSHRGGIKGIRGISNSGNFAEEVANAVGLSFKGLTKNQIDELERRASINPEFLKTKNVKVKESKSDKKYGTRIEITSEFSMSTLRGKKVEELMQDKKKNKKIAALYKEVTEGMTNLLVNYVAERGGDKELMRRIIIRMLNDKPYMFFFGRSTTQITGLMGEISAQYILGRIFAGKSQDELDMTWSAQGTEESRINAHRDIIIEELENSFGIQVKNSLAGLKGINTLTFSDATIGTVFNNFAGTNVLSQKEIDAIQQYYALRAFNVPYTIMSGKYKRTKIDNIYKGNTEFSKTAAKRYTEGYKKLEEVKGLVKWFMYQAAAILMFMNIGNNELKGLVDSNTLFLLANEKFVSAAEVLNQLMVEIDKTIKNLKSNGESISPSFKVAFSFDEPREIHTIVDYFNEMDSIREKRRIVAEKGEEIESFRQAAFQRIHLTSSYDFSSLIKS